MCYPQGEYVRITFFLFSSFSSRTPPPDAKTARAARVVPWCRAGASYRAAKCPKCMLWSRSKKVIPVTLFLVTMSAIAYLERHRPPPTLPKRFGQQRSPGLVIEPIFDDAAEDAPMAILAEPPLWRTWPHKTVVRAPGRHCAWARFAPPRTPGLQPPVNSSMICLRNETDLLCDEVRRIGYWPECADLPGLYTRAVATLSAEVRS